MTMVVVYPSKKVVFHHPPSSDNAYWGATAKVLVMGSFPHVANDPIGPHVLGQAVHTGLVQKVSTTVLAGGLGLARLMDKGDCQSLILGSAATVMVGDDMSKEGIWQDSEE